MFIKAFLVVLLATIALAFPQNTKQTSKKTEESSQSFENFDASTLTNRIEWIKIIPHTPQNTKEGDLLTVSWEPNTEVYEQSSQLIKSWSISIGTGSEFAVDNDYFMESERIVGVPTQGSSYSFQLPAQMENKQYCIVYTPYTTETGNERPMINGQPMEALYETWFDIQGSLQPGTGPKNAQNTYDNSASQQQQQQQQQGTTTENNENTSSASDVNNGSLNADVQKESGSNAISPAITAFIAVLFACLFI